MQQQQQQKSNDEYINCTWLSVVQLHLLMNNDHRDRIYSYGFSDSPHRCHHDFILFPASCLDVSLPFIYCCQRCAHGVLTAKHLCSSVASQCLFLYGNCLIRKVFFSYVDSWPGSMHRSINSFTSLFMALSCLWLCHGQFVRCIYSCVGRNITSTFFSTFILWLSPLGPSQPANITICSPAPAHNHSPEIKNPTRTASMPTLFKGELISFGRCHHWIGVSHFALLSIVSLRSMRCITWR